MERYKDAEISLDKSKGNEIAFIVHTSGTTQGTRKPLPFTDKVFNDTLDLFPGGLHSFLEKKDGKPLRVLQLFDFSSIMVLTGQLCSALARGDTLVLTYFGFMHPKFIRALDYYNVNVLFTTGFMVDKWLERADIDGIDLSTLKLVGISGGYISPEKMEQYRAFFKAHGYMYDITAGYGISEAGGKPLFAPKGNKEDIPLNSNGKLDIFRITRERLGEEAYNLIPIMDSGLLSDIKIELAEHVNSMTAGTLPFGMENHSAYDVFDLFTAASAANQSTGISEWNPLKAWGLFKQEKAKKKEELELPPIPESFWKIVFKYGNRVAGIPNGRKQIDFDFED